MSDRLCLGVSRSVRGRQWTYRHDPASLEAYAAETGLPLLQAALLSGRNVEPQDVEIFLSPTLKNSLPIEFDCRKADCGICIFKTLKGHKNLSQPTKKEADFLNAMQAHKDERLACQCRVMDDVEILMEDLDC